LKLVESIVETCKKLKLVFLNLFCLLVFCSLTSCSQKEKAGQEEIALRIGGSFSLLSLDQFSINSLGDSFIYSLIYDDVFKIEETRVSSSILSNLKLEAQSLSFKRLKKEVFNDLLTSYKEGLKSALWASHFKKFKLLNGSLKNLGSGSLQDLKIISSYFKLKGSRYGRYKVVDLIKNQRLKLRRKEKIDSILPLSLTFYKQKSLAQGLKSIQARKTDVYINMSELIDGDVKESLPSLNFIQDQSRSAFLRLYKKQNAHNYLEKTLKESMPQIRKVLNKSLVKNFEIKSTASKTPFKHKDLRVFFNKSENQKILDVLYPVYKALSGREIVYETTADRKLYKALVSGDFDYYLSFDIEEKMKKVSFQAFHSLGKYNTYRLKSRDLDLVLDRLKGEWDLVKRDALNKKALKVLSSLPFVVFEFESPHYKMITHKTIEKKVLDLLFDY